MPMKSLLESGFLWILPALALYGALHSLLASRRVKALAERWFGHGGRHYYRLFFVIVAALAFLPLPLLVWRLPDAVLYTVPYPWNLAMLEVQVLAVVGAALALRQTGGSTFLGLRSQDALPYMPLVQDGFYGVVRHPIYFFTFLFLWFFPVMSWNLLAFNLGVTIYSVIGAHLEERRLRAEFGALYDEYKARVPMFLPRLKRR